MMMFQMFTTLAALLLFASNAALAAPQGLPVNIKDNAKPAEQVDSNALPPSN